jgi:dTMP kinase
MALHQGLFISVEGIDGAGKSTQMATVREWAYSKGWDKDDVVSVREPGGPPPNDKLREFFLEMKANDLTEAIEDVAILLVAKRTLWRKVIKPALVAGKVVIADRWTDTLYAYQGYGFEVGTYKIHRMLDLMDINLWPDVTVWIDTPVATARERMELGRGQSQMSPLDKKPPHFFERVRQGYFERAQEHVHRIIAVDGSLDTHEVSLRVRDALNARTRKFLHA